MHLSALVRIKLRKVQRAEGELRKQREHLQAAQAAKAQASSAHQAYQHWSREEEQRLFEQHRDQRLDRHALDHWRREVGLLGEREAALHGRILECEQALERQHARLQHARQWLATTRDQLNRFRQLHERACEKARLIEACKQEQEQEEQVAYGAVQS